MAGKPVNLHLPDVPQIRFGENVGKAEMRQIEDSIRVCRRNFQRVKELLERGITSGAVVAPGVVGESQLTTAAKTLVGDVTGLTGSLGATVVERIQGKPIPVPTASEDNKLPRYDDGTDAMVWASILELLELISTTQGEVLFRGAAGWEVLGVGTALQVLTTNGAFADPSWQDASSAVPGVDFNILTDEDGLILDDGEVIWT
jgi:hypothetical protein